MSRDPTSWIWAEPPTHDNARPLGTPHVAQRAPSVRRWVAARGLRGALSHDPRWVAAPYPGTSAPRDATPVAPRGRALPYVGGSAQNHDPRWVSRRFLSSHDPRWVTRRAPHHSGLGHDALAALDALDARRWRQSTRTTRTSKLCARGSASTTRKWRPMLSKRSGIAPPPPLMKAGMPALSKW